MQARHSTTAINLFPHGSSVQEANRSGHDLVNQIQEEGPCSYVRAAFLDLVRPDWREAVDADVGAGIRRVVIIPYFLTTGVHLLRDLPGLVAPLKSKYPGLEIEVGRSLNGCPLMTAIVLDRVQEILGETKTAR